MDSMELLAPLFFVIVSLVAGAILKYALKRTVLPYTVGLFAFGLIIGLLDRMGVYADTSIFKASIDFAGNIDPDLILYLFLPILIFDAAYELDVHIFRKTLGNATLLSGPGMVVAMGLTGLLMMGISLFAPNYAQWNWTHALMFGALISATDPVAVVALLKELGVSKRFSTLVDGESMLNDGTGIVLFMLFFGTFTASGGVDAPIIDFIYVVLGGLLLGVILGWVCLWFITRSREDAVMQNSAILVSAYVTFFLAQNYMGVSGVIALVGYGLVITYYGRPRIAPEVNHFMQEFWELATYMANTLIFILVGVVIALQVQATLMDFVVLILVYIGINVVRMLMITLFYPIMKRSGYGLSKREAVILCWGGLRGALGLTLALMVSYTLPIPEPVRRQVLFLTAGIVTLTLTVNATTIRWLLRKFGLTRVSSAKAYLNYTIHKQLCENTEKYYHELQQNEALRAADWEKVAAFLPVPDPAPAERVKTQDLVEDIRLRILDKERTRYWQLYEKGIISTDSLRRLLAVVEELYDSDGKRSLSDRAKLLEMPKLPLYLRWKKRSREVLYRWVDRYHSKTFVAEYDLARGLIHSQRTSITLLDELEASGSFDQEDIRKLEMLRREVKRNMDESQAIMDLIAKHYPSSYRLAITQKTVRMLISNEKATVTQMLHEGLVAPDDVQSMLADINKRYRDTSLSRITKK
ncbi:MAG TPA: sodium:proton antiporter [Candidatus Rikenella faecigallinarum]|uniref:Sodium:proton antiporter n=1 Tax=Candidatus Rikenella faecigallinarum TaxID=2838745 RepID=A0A9D1QD92_9BACT|nr:sodium:proton antiporter [Candidatus Rikenella faecigallinarum]